MALELNAKNTLFGMAVMVLLAYIVEPTGSSRIISSKKSYIKSMKKLVQEKGSNTKNCSASFLNYNFAMDSSDYEMWTNVQIQKENIQRDSQDSSKIIFSQFFVPDGTLTFNLDKIFVKDRLMTIYIDSDLNPKLKFKSLKRLLKIKLDKNPDLNCVESKSRVINEEISKIKYDSTIFHTWFDEKSNELIELVYFKSNLKTKNRSNKLLQSYVQLNYSCAKNLLEFDYELQKLRREEELEAKEAYNQEIDKLFKIF